MQNEKHRCHWVDKKDDLYILYHDTEWGVPVHDDSLLFEMLILEMFVAGLSWQCVLHKRNAFRRSFDNFDVKKVALYDTLKIEELLQEKGIIRHIAKIKAAVDNAKVFILIQQQYGSFDNYLWQWTEGKTMICDATTVKNDLSDSIAKDLKKRGMKFLGSVTVYSYLCAVGVILAHEQECFLNR